MRKLVLAAAVAAVASSAAQSAVTGFNQTGVGPYDYNDLALTDPAGGHPELAVAATQQSGLPAADAPWRSRPGFLSLPILAIREIEGLSGENRGNVLAAARSAPGTDPVPAPVRV